jgi:two-component system response regulator AtoC
LRSDTCGDLPTPSYDTLVELSLVVLGAPTEELVTLLSHAGARVHAVVSVEGALDLVSRIAPDAVVVDVDAKDPASIPQLVRRFAPTAVLVAGRQGVKQAVFAFRAGARDFLPVPFERSDLEEIRRALSVLPDDDIRESDEAEKLLGSSTGMQRVRELIRKVAPTEMTVLVQGETGTGKELVARALHELSNRCHGPFVKVHCAGLPEALLENELFGHVRGAFAGAVGRPGRVEIAEGGTLFFDEVGDISLTMQVKLLRLLQDRQYERLGSTTVQNANVRFVAATHRPLKEMVASGQFREDLFHRLTVIEIWVPPLRSRDRRGDVIDLATRFCALFSQVHQRPGVTFSTAALEALAAQRWPGNVRQLQNFVERLVVLQTTRIIDADDVARALAPQNQFVTDSGPGGGPGLPGSGPPIGRSGPPRPLAEAVRAAERAEIEYALRYTQGNKPLAAKELRIGRATLFRKIAELGIEYPPSGGDGG